MTVLDLHGVDLWWGKAAGGANVSHAWGGSGHKSFSCEFF